MSENINLTGTQARETAELEDNAMQNKPPAFFTYINLRLAVLNAVVVAIVGVTTVYTGNLLTQQAIAARLDRVEAVMQSKAEIRDKQIDRLDENTVTKEVLTLTLKPILDEQKRQGERIDQIFAAVTGRNPPAGSQ